MEINMIVAVDSNGGIGKDNKLLWHIPGDLKRFKEITIGKTVVMGRKTFESLPFKDGLPNRKNIVLTRTPKESTENVVYVNDIADIINMNDDEIFIIGGAEIYKQFMPHCKKIYLTQVFTNTDADTFFEMSEYDFELIESSNLHKENGFIYEFLVFEKNIKRMTPLGKFIGQVESIDDDGLFFETIGCNTIIRNLDTKEVLLIINNSEIGKIIEVLSKVKGEHNVTEN